MYHTFPIVKITLLNIKRPSPRFERKLIATIEALDEKGVNDGLNDEEKEVIESQLRLLMGFVLANNFTPLPIMIERKEKRDYLSFEVGQSGSINIYANMHTERIGQFRKVLCAIAPIRKWRIIDRTGVKRTVKKLIAKS